MNKLQLQTEYNGEWFDVWETKSDTIKEARKEIDGEQNENGWLRLLNDEGTTIDLEALNGGF